MSLAFGKLARSSVELIQIPGVRYFRWRVTSRGKTPRFAKSLQETQEKWNYKDPEVHFKVNIGYSLPKDRKVELAKRLEEGRQLRNNYALKKAAWEKTLVVPLNEVQQDWRTSKTGPTQIEETAEYYGIYNDLFEDAYFTPVIPLDIQYTYVVDEEYTSSVYRGNLLKPFEALDAPKVSYSAKDDELFTLAFTTPDCHLTQEKGEYLHWLIGNIPGNKIEAGEELCNYLRPFPPRGAGYCRYVFILYKQETRVDFSKYKLPIPCSNLTARTFYTYDFYRENQDVLTPAGLAFFQSDWDPSLTDFFHNVLDMPEPSFEYDFGPPDKEEQQWFPLGQPFNIYMDQHKEQQVLQRELLLEKLKEVHPFKGPPKRSKYPLAHRIEKTLPTWLKDDMRKRSMREGKWKYM